MLPYDFDPERPLPDNGEKLLKQAINARQVFSGHYTVIQAIENDAINQLLDRCAPEHSTYPAREYRYYGLMTYVNNQDINGLRKMVNYWYDWQTSRQPNQKIVNVTKFNPGEHYHCLNTKFDTLTDAKEHIQKNGHLFGSFSESFFYDKEGD